MQKLGLSWSSPDRPRLPVAFDGSPKLSHLLALDRSDLPAVNDLTPQRKRGRPKANAALTPPQQAGA